MKSDKPIQIKETVAEIDRDGLYGTTPEEVSAKFLDQISDILKDKKYSKIIMTKNSLDLYGDDNENLCVSIIRDETHKEQQKRLEQERLNGDWERKTYEKLKAKFEGDK